MAGQIKLVDQYKSWRAENERDIHIVDELAYCPMFTAIMPVFDVTQAQLKGCVKSLLSQTYENWEAWLIGDESLRQMITVALRKCKSGENVHVLYVSHGTSVPEAVNEAMSHAAGEFVSFVSCKDMVAPNAFYEFAKKLNENQEYDFVYSDEDIVSRDGASRHDPFFKPDWSPNTFLDAMYTGHMAIYRKSIADAIGGMRREFGDSWEYDFVLRFMECSDNGKVGHILKVLYHSRECEGLSRDVYWPMPCDGESAKRAKEEALQRRGYHGHAEYVGDIGQYRVVYDCEGHDKVSIIIPSKDNESLLLQCVHSIREHTIYDNYEIIIVDNGSDRKVRDELSEYCANDKITYYYKEMPFNFSRMCNIGAGIASGDYLLFLNDDIEVISDDWMNRMLGHASLPHVGAVGAKLLYPNSNRIQHAGVVNYYALGPGHMLSHFEDAKALAYGRNRLNCDVIAVTGACLLVGKAKYDQVGGFDEELAIAYNDVELCLKLFEAGYYNVIDNDAILYHHESVSRGTDEISPEKAQRRKNEASLLNKKHPMLGRGDPFYNINLVQDKPDYGLKVSPCFIDANKKVMPMACHSDEKGSGGLVLYIDQILMDDMVSIIGWFYWNSDDLTDQCDACLVLRASGRKCLYYEIYRDEREDVAYALNCHVRYAGFCCVVPSQALRLDKKRYQIGICARVSKFHLANTCWSDCWVG